MTIERETLELLPAPPPLAPPPPAPTDESIDDDRQTLYASRADFFGALTDRAIPLALQQRLSAAYEQIFDVARRRMPPVRPCPIGSIDDCMRHRSIEWGGPTPRVIEAQRNLFAATVAEEVARLEQRAVQRRSKQGDHEHR